MNPQKDENEQYRKMVMETVQLIMQEMGSSEVDSRLEEQLIDGNHKLSPKIIFRWKLTLKMFRYSLCVPRTDTRRCYDVGRVRRSC